MKTKVFFGIAVIAIGFMLCLSFGEKAQAQNWDQMAGNVATISGFSSVAYGNGVYVATSVLAQDNTPSAGNYTFTARIYTSPDLATWTQQGSDIVFSGAGTIGTRSGATGFNVNFWNDTFVAWLWFSNTTGANPNSRILTSTNGSTWTPRHTGTDAFVNVNYTSNTFFATHLSRSYDASPNTTTVTYKIRSSVDASTWTERYSNSFSETGRDLGYGSFATFWFNSYVAWVNVWNYGPNPDTATSKLLFSSDGITWAERYAGTGWLSFARLRNTMAMSLQIPGANTTTKILTSTDDGYNWTERYNPANTGTGHINIGSNSEDTLVAWTDIANAGQFTVKMLSSSDGITWTERYNQGFTGTNGSLTTSYANPYFATRIYYNAAGNHTVKLLFAPDGQTWTENYSNVFANANAPGLGYAYRNSNFIAFGNNGANQAIMYRYTQPVTIWFSGTVRDTNANPVAGAAVTSPENPSASAVTSGTGDFKLTGITPGTPYTVRIAKTGYWPSYARPTPYLPPNTNEYMTNSASESIFLLYTNSQVTAWGAPSNKGFIAGRAMDGFSQQTGGFNGITVTAGSGQHPGTPYVPLYSDTLGVFGGTATYPNGRFWVFNIDDGDTVTMNVTAVGWTFEPQSLVIHAGAVTSFGLYGTPTGATYRVSGTVKDLATNLPLPFADVAIRDANSGIEVARPRTNEAGYYLIDLIATGQYSLTTSRFGYEDLSAPQAVELSVTTPNVTVNRVMSQSESPAIALSPGWNFISFPKLPLLKDIPTVLADASGNLKTVWGYDNQNQTWKKWTPTGGGSNTLTSMETGKGYWAYMDASANIATTGWEPPASTTIHLYENWNLIGYLGTNNTSVSTSLTSIASKWSIVWGWETGIWYGKHPTILNLPPPLQSLSVFNQGKAYWIKIKTGQATDWTAP